MSKSIFCALLALAATGAFAATNVVPTLDPAQWQRQQRAAFEKSEEIFKAAQKRDGLIVQLKMMVDAYNADTSLPFHVIFSQYLAWVQTYVGEYAAARTSYAIRQVAEPSDAPSPLRDDAWRQQPATEALAKLTRDRQAVFFNEAHNIVQTRTLTVRMLKTLREQGFDYFAAETLYETDRDLAKRGYPTAESGFYMPEPVYAEMVRTALDLGYKVVAYEAVANPRGDAREREQARHLYDRVFGVDPNARLVVNAGYAHIQETGKYLDGKSMANYFRERSKIDPLTIEQTMMIEHDTPDHDHPIYRAVIAATHPRDPVVYVNGDGEPWSLKPGLYDVSVFLPPDVDVNGRPSWLDLGGLRQPFKIDQDLCGDSFPCLIEARYADEGRDAIPADRAMLFHREPIEAARFKQLYLRPGKYVMDAIDHSNNLITRRRISVGGGQ